MEALLVSIGVVALGEMGDKTQLLAILLAAKFRRPVPIILGILVATLANHSFAGAVGNWVAQALGPDALRWVIGVSFIAMAVWMLIPDEIDERAAGGKQRFGVFGTTVLAFFLAEMGDKTQIATVALAARYDDLVAVVAGTTLGMMLANVPAVFLGDIVAKKVSMRLVHGIAAVIFGILGLLTLFNVGKSLLSAPRVGHGPTCPWWGVKEARGGPAFLAKARVVHADAVNGGATVVQMAARALAGSGRQGREPSPPGRINMRVARNGTPHESS